MDKVYINTEKEELQYVKELNNVELEIKREEANLIPADKIKEFIKNTILKLIK